VRLSLNRMTQHKGIQRIIKALCIHFFFFSFRAELAEAKKRAKTYKERKKHDRFDGMPEEEVSKRVLPDHLTNNLDIIIVSLCIIISRDSQIRVWTRAEVL